MIYLFLADGFEETEAIAALDVIRRGEIEISTVGIKSKLVTGSHGITVLADLTIDEINLNALEGIVLPGGMPGTLHLEQSNRLQEIITYCAENNLLIASICAAPSILGKRGLLDGKEAICFEGFEPFLQGASLSSKNCVTSGNIITAKAMGSAIDFGLAIVSYLKTPEVAQHIERSICHG